MLVKIGRIILTEILNCFKMKQKVYLLFTEVRYYKTNFFGRKSVHYETIQSKAIDFDTLQKRIELYNQDENTIEQYYYILNMCRVLNKNK
jgi:hypothetical protein